VNWTPNHCEKHKTDEEQNLVERPCQGLDAKGQIHGSLMILNDKNLCEYCDPASFKTAQLAKQNALMSYLDSRGLTGNSTDTVVNDGECGKERPDRVYDLGNRVIVLECDEHQHRERACECEQTRMVNIGQGFGGTPVYFIRWNPDNYTPASATKEQDTLIKRHKLCGDLIEDIKNERVKLPTALVSAIYLYYDGWASMNKEKWVVISQCEH
jgi:hypothetical protein